MEAVDPVHAHGRVCVIIIWVHCMLFSNLLLVLTFSKSMYKVFLNAPSKADIFNDINSHKWHTISSSDSYSKSTRLGVDSILNQSQASIFPFATLEVVEFL